MHSRGVLLEVRHDNYGSTRGSGLQIDNIIITHGSILVPLCFTNSNNNNVHQCYINFIKDLQNADCKNISFHILPKLNRLHRHLHDCNTASDNSCSYDYSLREVKLLTLYNYKRMLDISKDILNWTTSRDMREGEYNELPYLLFPIFIFLTIGKPSKSQLKQTLNTFKHFLQNSVIYTGLPVVVESTPFGNVSFLNSWSQGIVSKVIGSENDGIVIDARLVSGCEGGPIYVFEHGVKTLPIGIVVHMMSWCSGDPVGFSLGVSLKHLIDHVLGTQAESDYLPFNNLTTASPSSQIDLEKLSACIVFVRCHHKWGSGVVIDAKNGAIITCSHVVQCDHDAVYVTWNGKKIHAKVVYASPTSALYDIAILSVGRVPGMREIQLAETRPKLGERVIAAGYPLSTEGLVSLNDNLTLSVGCVAKVSSRGGPLQTTCCTHAGLSGGALIRPPDQLLGIVVSNAMLEQTVLPLFSFAVSIQDLRAPVKKYLLSRDPIDLQSLYQDSSSVKMEWSLVDCKL